MGWVGLREEGGGGRAGDRAGVRVGGRGGGGGRLGGESRRKGWGTLSGEVGVGWRGVICSVSISDSQLSKYHPFTPPPPPLLHFTPTPPHPSTTTSCSYQASGLL